MSTKIREKAQHSRYDQIVWQDRDGTRHEERVTAETVKAALLACGTKRRFTVYSARTAVPHAINWSVGICYFRNLLRGHYAHG